MKTDVLIVDGRNLLWRNADAFSELSTTVDGEEISTGGMYGFVAGCIRIHARYGGRMFVAWEGTKNFRYDLFPDYKKKSERTSAQQDLADEVHANEGRLIELLSAAGTRQFSGIGCEADDVMGTIAKRASDKGKRVTIYTGDSDLRQLVGKRIRVASPGRGKAGDAIFDTADSVLAKHGVKPGCLPHLKALSGDSSDCQPTGTLVKVAKWDGVKGAGGTLKYEDKRIERLRVGDRVLSYDSNNGWFSKEVLSVGRFKHDGDLISVKTESGLVSRYTSNHRCLARTNNFDGKHFVYLMKKGRWFRVGVTRYGADGTGLSCRMNDEGAEAAWVLSVHESLPQALLSEAFVSHQYGIPDVRFNGKKSSWVDDFWPSIGDLTGRGRECLLDHGRMIEYPLIDRANNKKLCGNRLSEMRACNLMDGMSVVTGSLPSTSRRKWKNVWQKISVSRKSYVGNVYSLKVERNENYVADGILTHNSIPGLPGIGDKTAQALVGRYRTVRKVIEAARNDDDGWPVADRFKSVVSDHAKAAILYLKLTTIDTEAKLKVVPVRKDRDEVVRLLTMYKFRSLSTAAELMAVLRFGR